MSHELFDEQILCFFFVFRDALWIRDDDFLEMIDGISVDVISVFYFADRHLCIVIITEYSNESPSRVSPYITLCTIYLGSSPGVGV